MLHVSCQLLHVSAPRFHHQGVISNKVWQALHLIQASLLQIAALVLQNFSFVFLRLQTVFVCWEPVNIMSLITFILLHSTFLKTNQMHDLKL